MIEAGNILLPMPDTHPWVEDTLLEFCTFPAAKHDDRVDAASQALIWMQSKGHAINAEFFTSVLAANAELTKSAHGDGGSTDRLPSAFPEGGFSNPWKSSRWSM